nr:carcinoembryonic antigen-related cell adhesion molecule 5-like isoform X1 [Danio rerio]|eukprot:XP_017206877.2 carcinoembryonic antigen-related cell adhesion molecule 5-like isoform X1 [Danio rerio]
MFIPNKIPSTAINVIIWQFGTTIILTGNPDSPSVTSAYRDRVSFDKSTLSLELRNLKLEDSGSYSLTLLTSSGDQLRGETLLHVFDYIHDVILIGPEEALIERESSANITSKGSGTITSVQWMKDNSPLSSSSRIIFSSDNRSVSISPVERSDTGEYQCTYSNPVSSETAKLTLIINYGPDGVSIRGPDVVDLGVQVSLSCSAKSEPSASFSWTFNGLDTGVTRDTLTIDKTDFTDSGKYICTAFNRITNRRESQKHMLLVQGKDHQLPELINGAVGESVKLTPNNPPSTAIDIINWQFGTTIILTGNPHSPVVASAYRDRVSFDKNTLALELRNLKLEDSGSYSLTVVPSSGDQVRGETTLQVFAEPKSFILVDFKREQGNNGVTMKLLTDESSTMMASNSLYWILWMVTCFGEYLGQDLQFPGQTYGAIGGSVMFTPENLGSIGIDVQITWNFGATNILTGKPESPTIVPAYVDRVSFDQNTLSLELRNLKMEDSGSYILTVTPVSGDQLRGETTLQLFENITNVRLTGPEETLIEDESFANITSEGSGTITSVQWMKDNSPLSSSSRIIFSSDNRSVSISPVERSDTGEYQCTYSNPVSSETAKLTLIINYGPEGVSIKGPDEMDLGVQVFLSCFANSEPSASFSWTLNGSDTGVTTDKYTIDKTDFTDSGEYICTAYNRVTNRSESIGHVLRIQVGGGGLSTGAVVGIAIGVSVAVSGFCGLIVYFTKNNIIPKPNCLKRDEASGATAQRGQELDISFEETNNFPDTNGDGNHIYENRNEIYENAPNRPSCSTAPPLQARK